MLNQITFYQVLGLPLIAWGGIITLLCFITTAVIAYLTIKRIKNIPVKWHMRMAAISLLLAIIHGILGILSFL